VVVADVYLASSSSYPAPTDRSDEDADEDEEEVVGRWRLEEGSPILVTRLGEGEEGPVSSASASQ
jgi:hypothetical protein